MFKSPITNHQFSFSVSCADVPAFAAVAVGVDDVDIAVQGAGGADVGREYVDGLADGQVGCMGIFHDPVFFILEIQFCVFHVPDYTTWLGRVGRDGLGAEVEGRRS